MTDDGLQRRLKNVLAEEVGYRSEMAVFDDDTSLRGRGLELDSVDVIALVMRVEEEFEIFFEDDELAKSVETVESLARAVRSKLGDRDG